MLNVATWAVIFATFFGPIFAVLTTRWLDDRRSRRDRQREIFETLMLTRRAAMSKDHVDALNRIELYFSRDREVMSSLRLYLDNLSEKFPQNGDAGQVEVFIGRRRRLFVDLVHIIGSRLSFSTDRLDLIEGGYHPQGWLDDEETARSNMRLIKELLSGARPLWMTQAPPAFNRPDPFPPAPEPEQAQGGGA